MIEIIVSAFLGASIAVILNWGGILFNNRQKKKALAHFFNNTLETNRVKLLEEIEKSRKYVSDLDNIVLEHIEFPVFNSNPIKELKYYELYSIYKDDVHSVYSIAGYLDYLNDKSFPSDVVNRCYAESKKLLEYFRDFQIPIAGQPTSKNPSKIKVKMSEDQFKKSKDFRKPTTELALKRLESIEKVLNDMKTHLDHLNGINP
jgi:hypothetical protein